jgi:alkylation response protein AidB-like acyl-CoA dehydrogenase
MTINEEKKAVPATDPTIYDQFEDKWSKLPENEVEWIQRARDVAEILAQDVVQRDRDNKSPRAEVVLLKHSKLLKVLGPKKYGGGEQPWSVGYKLIREVSKADGYDTKQKEPLI